MANEIGSPTFTISVRTRHSNACPKRNNPQWQKCTCRKQLYIYDDGLERLVSAGTRIWSVAEERARKMRDDRDPAKVEQRRAEKVKEQRREKQNTTIEDALKQWLAGMKTPRATSMKSYTSTAKKIGRWAKAEGVIYMMEITPFLLDKWRSSWHPEADERENRIALTTQSALLVRLGMFLHWALGVEIIERNPAANLKAVSPRTNTTWPLNPSQFEEVMAATYKMDEVSRYRNSRPGQHLRALFLVQRWSGLRISDVVKMPKREMLENKLSLTLQKTSEGWGCVLPDHVVQALRELPTRFQEHTDYYFWSRRSTPASNVNRWVKTIAALRKHLDLKDEEGNPLTFRSHMLRDTFAVEMRLAGVPLEDVSKMLGHASLATTERYYSKHIKRRQSQLETVAIEAMRRQGVSVTMPTRSLGNVTPIRKLG